MSYRDRVINHDDGQDIVSALNVIAGKIGNLGSRQQIYGYRLYLDVSDPNKRIVYIADNASYEPAYMDFTNDKFEYGSWKNAFFMPKPCMLTYAGQVAYYLNPDNYAQKENGEASNVADTSFGGNAMMEWGKIYYKRVSTDSYYEFYVSNYKIDSDYVCWNNYNANGETQHFYTPIYPGSYDGTRLRSLSGQENMVSQTASAERARAQANGSGWDIEQFVDRMLINDLLVLLGKSTNTQAVYGQGSVNNPWNDGKNIYSETTGTADKKGLFWGGSAGTTDIVKVFGMESYWGTEWRRYVGWVFANGIQKVKMTYGTEDGSTANGYNLTGDGYISIADSGITGNSGGYISGTKQTIYGRLPETLSGSSSTYDADVCRYDASIVAVARFGGYWPYGASCGAFSVNLSRTAGNAYSDIGASPSFK